MKMIHAVMAFAVLGGGPAAAEAPLQSEHFVWAIKPQFSYVRSFHRDHAPAYVKKGWGIIDKTGRWTVKPRYWSIAKNKGGPFAAALARGKWGYITPKGEVLVEHAFKSAIPFSDGYGAVEADRKWAIVDSKGAFVTDFLFESPPIFENGIATTKMGGKRGLVYAKQGFKFVPFTMEAWNVRPLTEGLAKFEHKGKRGFLDAKGRVRIPARYEDARPFRNGHAAVALGSWSQWILIDEKGRKAFNGTYHLMRDFADGFVPVLRSIKPNRWVYLNLKGGRKLGWEKDLIDAYSFHEGYALVSKGKGYFFITTKGKRALKGHFKSAEPFRFGFAAVKRNGKWGFIKLTDAAKQKRFNALMKKIIDKKIRENYRWIEKNLNNYSFSSKQAIILPPARKGEDRPPASAFPAYQRISSFEIKTTYDGSPESLCWANVTYRAKSEPARTHSHDGKYVIRHGDVERTASFLLGKGDKRNWQISETLGEFFLQSDENERFFIKTVTRRSGTGDVLETTREKERVFLLSLYPDKALKDKMTILYNGLIRIDQYCRKLHKHNAAQNR